MSEMEWTWAWNWWSVLVAINVVNLIACGVLFSRSRNSDDIEYAYYGKLMRNFGAIFILVAVYRSVFVSSYLNQLAWFDTLANSSLLIRFFAIFAEISFASLIMLALLQLNKEVPHPAQGAPERAPGFLLTKAPYVLFACIFIAQFFATTATITKIEILFAIEETLWGIAFMSILPLTLVQRARIYSYKDSKAQEELKSYRGLTLMMAVFTVGYCAYSLLYHLPIELWPDAIAQWQMESPIPAIRTGGQAVRDAFFVVNETKDFASWGGIGFFIWYTGYFSLCGWMVLFLMTGPKRVKINGQ
ncbi:MAG: hypothetical protein V7709_06620 [Halioglobus sp.]